MKYKIVHIEKETDQIGWRNADFPVTSYVFNQLREFGFTFAGNDDNYDLIIFRATSPLFFKIKYLHALLKLSRPVSQLLENENTTDAFLFKPVLTLYSSKNLQVDRQIKFGLQYWDSCIWQRWVDVDDQKDADAWKIVLTRVLKEFSFYFQFELYKKDVSIEYCDFLARIYKESYLVDQGTDDSHANYVTPFPFFSESKFNHHDRIKTLTEFTWRVLLVDDEKLYKLNFLKFLLSDYNPAGGIGMFNVIDLTNKSKADEPAIGDLNKDRPTIILNQVYTVEDAENELKREDSRYDVVFLDFLLAEKLNSDERQTGKDLLDKLESSLSSYRKGVAGKFWIFPTTSYSTAFLDHLQQDLTSLLTDYWNIERGASFVQTPNYFLSAFSEFLLYQVKATNIHNLKDTWKNCLLLLNSSRKFSRAWANETLTRILNNWAETESLESLTKKNEIDNISFADTYFLSSYYQSIKYDYDSGLYSYLSQLLYMLSFSDGHVWEQTKTCMEMVRALTLESPELQVEEIENLNTGFSEINHHINMLRKVHDP